VSCYLWVSYILTAKCWEWGWKSKASVQCSAVGRMWFDARRRFGDLAVWRWNTQYSSAGDNCYDVAFYAVNWARGWTSFLYTAVPVMPQDFVSGTLWSKRGRRMLELNKNEVVLAGRCYCWWCHLQLMFLCFHHWTMSDKASLFRLSVRFITRSSI